MIRYILPLLIALTLAVIPVSAGKYNTKLNIGDAAPAWSELPGVDGKPHSLGDLKNKDLVVVVFLANQCAFSELYEDRIIEFTKQYAGPDSKVALVAIGCSNLKGDKLPDMKVRAQEKGYNFVYVHDETQDIGRAYGATVTPEFFILDKARKIAYMGAMDDANKAPKVKEKYLEDALTALLKGQKPAVAETPARGCSIEYAKPGK